MNDACHQAVAEIIATLPRPKRVVELGSLNVNGCVTDLIFGAKYIGVDIQPGPNVTVVADAATYDPPWVPDLVLCLNVLEHTTKAEAIITNAWRMLAPEGTLILCVPDETWPPHGAAGGKVYEHETYEAYTPEMVEALMVRFDAVTMLHHDQLIYAKGEKGMEITNDLELRRTADRRLNLGCGDHPMHYWTNLDQRVGKYHPEIVGDALEYLQACDEGEYDEIYAGHFIEHLHRSEAVEIIREAYRVLIPGGKLGILVPDTREIFKRYVNQAIDAVEFPHGTWWSVSDLDSVCALFIYSTVQASGHKWAWDMVTLARQFALAGFEALREIDRHRDARIPVGAWYQCGIDGKKPQDPTAPTGLHAEALQIEAKFAEAINVLAQVEEI